MRDDNVSASPHDARAVDSRGRIAVTAVFALAFLATFLVYRPDRNVPFDFVDFSEFLPLLQGDSFFARLKSLLDYYLNQQGRANVVPYAILAAKWGWFGDYSPAWQWLRFGTMWGIILLTFLLLRRIGL